MMIETQPQQLINKEGSEKKFTNNYQDFVLTNEKDSYQSISFAKILPKEIKFIDKYIPPSKNIDVKSNLIKFNTNYVTVVPQVQLPFPSAPADGFTLQLSPDRYKDRKIEPEDLVHLAYPIVQFIHEVQPDAVIALDRGARPIGLAVRMLWRRIYPDERFPTHDGSIKFRKISRKSQLEVDYERLRSDVDAVLSVSDNPTVLVLDDWISSGGTQELVKKLLVEESGGRIRTLFGVMRGRGADISGDSNSFQLGVWHDRADITGVDYEGIPLKPIAVRDKQAKEFRARMLQGINEFVSTLDIKRQIYTSE